MSLVQQLHDARKDRLARIAAAAAKPKPVLVLVEAPPPVIEPKDIFNPEDERAWMMEVEGFFPEDATRAPSLEDIIRVVCTHYSVSKTELLATRRNGPTSAVRHVTYYLCRRLTLNSLTTIGRKLGDRDHTTILHGVRRVEDRMRKDDQLMATVEMLVERLGGEK